MYCSKRWDLIPNLVAIVKHHLEFKQQTLAEITRLRSQVMSRGVSAEQRLTLENQISRTMGNIDVFYSLERVFSGLAADD